MTPIEKQILKNQNAIMNILVVNMRGKHSTKYLMDTIIQTAKLLNPKKSEEPACPMAETPEEDVIVSNSETKLGKGYCSESCECEVCELEEEKQ